MGDLITSGRTGKALAVGLDGLAARQRAISNNLANVNTPGFKASEVHFEEQLHRAIAQDQQPSSAQPLLRPVAHNSKHFAIDGAKDGGVDSVQPRVVRDVDTTIRADGNNVDIDKEMVELAEATIQYNSLVQLIAARVSLARYAVNEGRR